MKMRDKYHTEKILRNTEPANNKVTSLVQQAKTEFYSVTFNTNHENPRFT